MMHEPVYVIGDSHTRAFVNNRNFVPLFVDQGKKLNLISDDSFKSTLSKIKAVINAADIKKAMLYLAEPDTRYYLGKGWQPWKKPGNYNLQEWEKKAQGTANRYISLVREVRPSVDKLSVLSIAINQRPEQNEMADYINAAVSKRCEDLDTVFVDINKEVYGDNGKALSEFCGDLVHHNNKIQPLVEEILITNGFLEVGQFSGSGTWVTEKIKRQFKYNEKFGCYTLR